MAKRKARPGREGGRARTLFVAGVAQEGVGLCLVGLGLLSTIALATYHPSDPSFRLVPVENAAGAVGASIAKLLVGSLGLGAAVPVLAVLALGVRLLTHGQLSFPSRRFWAGLTLVLAALSTLPELLALMGFAGVSSSMTGGLGRALAEPERRLLSGPGALVINLLALVVGAPSLVGIAPADTLALTGRGMRGAARSVGVGASRGASLVGLVLRRIQLGLSATLSAILVWRERRARRERVAALREPLVAAEEPVAATPAEVTRPPQRARSNTAGPHIVDHRSERKEEPEQAVFAFTERTSSGPYTPPDAGQIFQPPPEGARRYDHDSLIMNSRILEKKLADFGVQGRVVTVHPGPVITMYEFEPAPGVKVNRITNLSDDLALALRALSIRIIAPIPGKSVVGIEVPNPDREVVYIRDLLESKSYRASPSKLTLALGKDIFGNPVEADLAAMPHVLVAGATGTGKSVFLNSLLCSILCRATPDEVKLLLVDPKLLELSIYEGIPHLIADVVTNPKRAAAALQGIVEKMEERYHLMAALGVRNIAQFNRRVDEAHAAGQNTFRLRPKPGESEGREVPYQRIPYIVVVIDELADLMVVSAHDVEESLQRLAQMARASGIHLVLATQRPSVDVLTGVIKANFPSRISFQVSSKTDSRTILDQGGAEHLLGQGDMLFLPPGTSKLQRLHGSFVSEREVTKLVEYLRTQGTPRFDDDLIRVRELDETLGERDPETDEHYDLAVQIVAETRNASISYIQRRLKVGYNRAARMIEQMEREGVVGPQVGVKARDVFIRPIGTDADVE
jgi:S-DNA-T family DNA segregation ATPase FtsK/SpoIIIE